MKDEMLLLPLAATAANAAHMRVVVAGKIYE